MGRVNNRTGFSKNRGSLNPPIHVGTTSPDNPVLNHLWIDTANALLKYWDGANWISVDGTP